MQRIISVCISKCQSGKRYTYFPIFAQKCDVCNKWFKVLFAITLFNACMPYNIPIWRIRLYLKKNILTQFHMTLTGLKTRKLLLCLPKNNIKKYRI